eukprot:gene8981-23214_t
MVKVAARPRKVVQEMAKVEVAAAACAGSMAIIVQSRNVTEYASMTAAQGVWSFGVVLHVFLMLHFVYRLLTTAASLNGTDGGKGAHHISTAVVATSACAKMKAEFEHAGAVVLYWGWIAMLLAFAPIVWALAKRQLGGRELPSSFILMAPAALCLSGTLAILDDHLHHALPPPSKNSTHQLALSNAMFDEIVYPLASLAGLCFSVVFSCFVPRLCRELWSGGFVPSTALCTFPSVICATAMLQLARHWSSQGCLGAGLVLLATATLIQPLEFQAVNITAATTRASTAGRTRFPSAVTRSIAEQTVESAPLQQQLQPDRSTQSCEHR